MTHARVNPTTTAVLNTFVAGRHADNLGTLKAQISDLSVLVDEEKACLIHAAAQTNVRCFEGASFRATVTFADKRVVDWKSVAALLVEMHGIPEDDVRYAIARNTETAEGVPTVRVSARKQES